MKLRCRITLAVVVLVFAEVAFDSISDLKAKREVQQSRRALRKEGFKLDLEDFTLNASAEMRERARVMVSASEACDDFLRAVYVPLMYRVGTNTAWAAWSREKLETELSEDSWPSLRTNFVKHYDMLDRACAALLSGPIQYEPQRKNGALLFYSFGNRYLAQAFAARMALELHDGHDAAAWTNLLAATRLVTACRPEPIDVSRGCYYQRLAIAQSAIWEALQSRALTEGQLAVLQREWESLDLLTRLDETEAFARVYMTDYLDAERRRPLMDFVSDPVDTLGSFAKEQFRSPKEAWRELFSWPVNLARVLWYRKRGTYQDENAMLLYFRDRELEMKRAAAWSSWAEMQSCPGATNNVPFAARAGFGIGSLMNSRELGLIGVAEAEAQRRLLVTAIALERFHRKHGIYPAALTELVPAVLARVPLDFMDGQPLRYRCTEDAQYLLYSIGLDCLDDGGLMVPYYTRWGGYWPDLVWLHAASPAEVEMVRKGLAKDREGLAALRGQSLKNPTPEEIEFRKRYGLEPPPETHSIASGNATLESSK